MIDPAWIVAFMRDPATPAWAQAILSTLSIVAVALLFWLEQRSVRALEHEKAANRRIQMLQGIEAFAIAARDRCRKLRDDVKEAHEYNWTDWDATIGHVEREITPFVQMADQFAVIEAGSPVLISAWTSFRVELVRVQAQGLDLKIKEPGNHLGWQLNAKYVDHLRRALNLFEVVADLLISALRKAQGTAEERPIVNRL